MGGRIDKRIQFCCQVEPQLLAAKDWEGQYWSIVIGCIFNAGLITPYISPAVLYIGADLLSLRHVLYLEMDMEVKDSVLQMLKHLSKGRLLMLTTAWNMEKQLKSLKHCAFGKVQWTCINISLLPISISLKEIWGL